MSQHSLRKEVIPEATDREPITAATQFVLGPNGQLQLYYSGAGQQLINGQAFLTGVLANIGKTAFDPAQEPAFFAASSQFVQFWNYSVGSSDSVVNVGHVSNSKELVPATQCFLDLFGELQNTTPAFVQGVDPAKVQSDLALLKQIRARRAFIDTESANLEAAETQVEQRLGKTLSGVYGDLQHVAKKYRGLQQKLVPLALFAVGPAQLAATNRRVFGRVADQAVAAATQPPDEAPPASAAPPATTVTVAAPPPATTTPVKAPATPAAPHQRTKKPKPPKA